MNLREICGTGTLEELGAKSGRGNAVTTVLIYEIFPQKK